MKYRKEDDNRYRVRFMRSTEELMDALTVKEFISYLEENAELEDDADCEYIDGEVVKCKAYDLKEADSNLHKEFLVTENGRLFYWLSLNSKIELVDRENVAEEKKEVMKKRTMKYGYREIRKIHADSLSNLCIAKNLYTRGNNEEYGHLLYDMAEGKENITTDDIVEIAQDITEHSDTDQEITSICFDIARIAITFFEET